MSVKWVYKGEGLCAAITAAGHFRYVENDKEKTSNDAAVQAIIDAYPLSAFQDEVCTSIDAYAATLRGVTTTEAATWPIKRAEAKAGTTDGMLASEAQARGITVQDLAAKVLAKSAALEGREAQIAGVAGKHKDTVRSLPTFEEVAGYNWRAGWPE